jgi:ribosomal protein S18 acetylase RimI-like enzyme
MNFYSDDIIKGIIDNEPLENIIDSIDYFKAHCDYLVIKYSLHTIGQKYTLNILNETDNNVVFYCLDKEFAMDNCPSIMIYRKMKVNNEIHYYILFTCTKRTFRGQGYASKLLDGFIDRVKSENANKGKIVKILLSSLESAVLFYEEYGFRWTKQCLSDYPVLARYEKYEKKKEYFIMEMLIIREP